VRAAATSDVQSDVLTREGDFPNDLHMRARGEQAHRRAGFQDATGDKAGIVVCEIPAKQQRCSIRETVFSWTTTRFPFHTSSDRKLKLIEAPIITLIGKAYWDVGHAPKDQSNRRSHLPGYAAWEIHPAMKLTAQ
jgi:hypothetical protein